MPSLRIDTTYKCVRQNGTPTYVRILAFDPIEKRYQIQTSRGVQYFDPSTYTSVTAVRDCTRGQKHARDDDLSLYLIHLGGTQYKVGCSKDVKKRMRNARTFAPHVRVVATRKIPRAVSAHWRRFESALLREVRDGVAPSATGGREIVNLSSVGAERAITSMRTMRFGEA